LPTRHFDGGPGYHDGRDQRHQRNTTVTALKQPSAGLKWTQLDQALPLPLELNDAMTQFLLDISDIPSLDRQMLQVTNLSSATYDLNIDGHQIGTFSREELAAGFNLALYSTPIEQQAKSIDWTADDRSKLSGTRSDLMTEGTALPGETAGVKTLDALDAKMIDDEYHNAQPKPHSFELKAEP